MNNTQRLEQAAEKMLRLAEHGLRGEVEFQALAMPDGKVVYAICFPPDKWDFDPDKQKLKRKQS